MRGQQQDYDHWAALGNRGWSWRECLPYFRKLEHNTLGDGRAAPAALWASAIRQRHELVDAFVAASNRLGVRTVDDFNTGDQEGVGYYQLTTRNGLRCSTAVAYLKPARRPNLHVETDAQALKVLFDGAQASGVRYVQHGKVHEVRALREVILAAGALQSPQLLQVSGVGPAALLNRHGIPVVADRAGVGENLQDHLQIRLIYEVTKPITTNDELHSWIGRAKMGLQWALFRGGPLAIGINQGGMFCRALPDESATPDIQFHFSTLSADSAGGSVHPFPGCTYSICQLRPESRGTVRIRTDDARDAPSIQPNYLDTERDRRTTVAGVRFAPRRATEPMAPLMRREVRPGADAQTDDELLEFCREYGQTIFHPSGTAKMGVASDPLAVVGERLRVRHARAARGRLLDHADPRIGQYQRADRDGRREGIRHDPRGRARGRSRPNVAPAAEALA